MSRVTSAFVCALCDPDNPRPASIMCSHNCGRYVCAVHAMPRKGPGSAMICLACAEALDLLDKPKSQPVLTPIVSIQSESDVPPKPQAEPIAAKPAPTPFTPPPAPRVEAKFDPDATLAGIRPIAPPAPTQIKPSVVPAENQSPAVRRLIDPPPPPQASETIVSQRGNTLQVPRVSTTLRAGPPPSSGNLPARPAKRADDALAGVDRQLIIMVVGSVVLGIAGFVMILAALAG
jgi:hypothetical protein